MRAHSILAPTALLLLVGAVLAAPRPAFDPNQKFPIVPEAGKWVICAASYTGPDAEELAQQLAAQIRQRDRLPAYTFSWSDAERKRVKEELDRAQRDNPDRVVRRRTIRVEEQWAVLIGGWADIDGARAALDKVKKLPFHELQLNSNRLASDVIVVEDPSGDKSKAKAVRRNPLHTAFVVRNPTVSADPKPAQKFDPLWKELNADESYSLLKVRKPYTLVVKDYRGVSVMQPRSASGSFLETLLPFKKSSESLNAAGMNAHNLAEVLRKLNFDAHVLHMRTNSVVTIGAFDSLDDPALARTQSQLAQLRERLSKAKGGDPIQLMDQPVPMEVPRM